MTHSLWSTDVAPEVSHPRPTRRDAATREGRRCPRIRPHPAASCHVAFSFFKPTWVDVAPTWADSRWIGPTRARISRNRLYRPKWPIQAQIGPIRSRVSASRHESALKKWKPRGMTRRDAARRAGSGVPRDSPHPAASNAGAAPLVPRPCFTASSRTLTNDNYSTVTFLYWWVIQNNEFIFIPVRVFKRCNVSFFNFLL